MGSTQNKNSKYDYLCEKKQSQDILNYHMFNNYGVHKDKELYFSIGSIPKTPRDNLSFNPIDTESYLRNIGSTDLENKSPQQFKPLDKSSLRKDGLFYDTKPLTLPNPMVIFKNQRAGLN